MPTTSYSWLHLTEFDYGLRGQKSLWHNLRQPFLDDLESLHIRSGPWHAFMFTGDLAHQGKSEEFREFQTEVIGRLWEKLNELGCGEAKLLAVPGNHDLYRPYLKEQVNKENPAVDVLLDKVGFQRIAEKFWDTPSSPYRTLSSTTPSPPTGNGGTPTRNGPKTARRVCCPAISHTA
jgi:hypothetical protein